MGASLEALAPPQGVACRLGDPVDVDGAPVGASWVPEDAESLAAALAALAAAGLAALPRGAGSQLGLGNPPRRADAFLSTEKLHQVDVLDAAEGVCHAGAGVPLAALREQVEAAGWELPLDDAGRGGTLGGALATAALTPRAQGLGRPRDVVLGLELAHPDGSRTRCGGRVVKNVTGYDLAKLYLGSLGALGVITGAWLRLRPRPEARARLRGAPLGDSEACARALEWSRRGALRAIALRDEPGGLAPWIELAGDAASVELERARFAREGFEPAGAAEREAAAAERFGAPPAGARFLVSLRPSRLAEGVAALRAAGASLALYPGLNLVCARFGADRTAGGFEAAARAAALGGGRALCEVAPLALKRGRDVFAAPAPEVALARKLKAQFDPGGVLNPGRGAGGV